MLQRLMNGVKAFWGALKNSEKDRLSLPFDERRILSSIGWEFYKNRAYNLENDAFWTAYFTQYKMHRLTRLLYNPVPLVAGFYVNGIWHGANYNPMRLEDGTPLLTPCEDETEENLLIPIAQLDQWGNWGKESNKIKERVSATGSALVEIIDDLNSQKVRHKVWWSSYVKEIALNDVDDVQRYVLEYETFDAQNKSYRFKKVVTKESYSYFRDDKPFTPDGKKSSVEYHDFGFCPAVWFQHNEDGSEAFTSYAKLNELNSFVSHALRHGHKAFESPKWLSTDGRIDFFMGGGVDATTGRSAYNADPSLEWVVLKMPQNASAGDLSGNLALADALPYAQDLIKSLGDEYHELQYYTLVKEQSQVSGVALERLFAPAQSCLDAASANYNPQLIKLRQMQIAIAGQRIKERSWTNLSDQQEKFRGFDLMSYERGLLNFNLKRSLLVQPNELEQEDLKRMKIDTANVAKGLVDEREALLIAGYNEEEITKILSRKKLETPVIPPVNNNPQDEMVN